MKRRVISAVLSVALVVAAESRARAETGVLIGKVIDEQTGRALPCRVYLIGSDGQFYFPDTGPDRDVVIYRKQRGQSVEHHATIGPGPFRARLPAGKVRVIVERGKEYIPLSADVEVVAGRPTQQTFVLHRWINMAERGWYSGDTHVHRSPAELPNVMLAEDLNVAFPLEQWEMSAYKVPSFKPDPAVLDRTEDGLYRIDATHVLHILNCEYEIFTVGKRRWTLGAVMILNARKPFEIGAPPVGPIAEAAHSQGALIDLEKHNWPWSMMLVPVMKVDLYELANNHIWRAKPFFLQFERAPKGGQFSHDARGWALYGFEVYYMLLNCGFRLAPSAGCASGVHPVPLGWNRVYAKVDGEFSYQKWIEALARGRSFVTNGPMLFLSVEGREPGATVHLADQPRPRSLRVSVVVEYARAVETVEVVVNGEVVETFKLDTDVAPDRAHRRQFDFSVALDRSSWIAARCFEKPIPDNVRYAHTGPVYVMFGNEPIRPRRSDVDYLIERVEQELARNRDVLRPQDLAEYEQALGVYRRLARLAVETKPAGQASGNPSATRPTSPTLSVRDELMGRLAEARKAYASVSDYTATFVKQERIRGRLRPRETGLFKFRKPFAVYVKWIDGPNKGTQALYVRGQNNGKLLARKGGLLSFKTFRLDPNGRLALRDNRHPVTEAGIGHLLDLLEANCKRAVAEGRGRVRRLPDDPKARPRGPRYELLVDADRDAGYYCRRAIVTFDPRTHLVVAVRVFDWDDKLVEDYRYLDLRINPGLTDRDFDPNNPDYGF